jgi:hypothetical protein
MPRAPAPERAVVGVADAQLAGHHLGRARHQLHHAARAGAGAGARVEAALLAGDPEHERRLRRVRGRGRRAQGIAALGQDEAVHGGGANRPHAGLEVAVAADHVDQQRLLLRVRQGVGDRVDERLEGVLGADLGHDPRGANRLAGVEPGPVGAGDDRVLLQDQHLLAGLGRG